MYQLICKMLVAGVMITASVASYGATDTDTNKTAGGSSVVDITDEQLPPMKKTLLEKAESILGTISDSLVDGEPMS